MSDKHLQSWLVAETCNEATGMAKWEWVVDIIQTSFRDVRIPEEFTWQTVVLLPKGNE